jgi:hypothetical protein
MVKVVEMNFNYIDARGIILKVFRIYSDIGFLNNSYILYSISANKSALEIEEKINDALNLGRYYDIDRYLYSISNISNIKNEYDLEVFNDLVRLYRDSKLNEIYE